MEPPPPSAPPSTPCLLSDSRVNPTDLRTTPPPPVRRAWEEAEACVRVEAPFAQVDIPVIGQVYLLYRASLEEGSRYGAGPETLESKFLPLDEVPCDDLAFSSVVTALRFFAADVEAGSFGFHSCVIDKDPGSSPSDPASYRVTQASRVPPLPYPARGGGG